MHGETNHGHHHHICNRCSWPYPNPHPSAKQRRSHKKVCGKLEGYKISEPKTGTHLAGSDEKHHSNENLNKVEEKSKNVKGNGEFDRLISNKSKEEEFSDANAEFAESSSKIVNPTTSDSSIKQSKDPSDGSQIQPPQALGNFEEQMENGTKQVHASSSDLPSVVDSCSDKIENVYPGNTQIGENVMEVTLSAAIDASISKLAIEESEIDAKLQKLTVTEDEISSDVTAATTIIRTDNGPMERVIDAKVSQDEISHDNNEGCIIKEVNGSQPVHPEHAQRDVEEFFKMTVEDGKDEELLIREVGLAPECSSTAGETELHHEKIEEAHLGSNKSGENPDFTVPEEQVLENNLQYKEGGSTVMVQEVIVEGQADISVAKDTISKGIESDILEALPDTTNKVSTLSQTEKDEIVSHLEVQEPHCSQPDESNKIVPEAYFLVLAGGGTNVSPSDSENHEAIDAISGDNDVVPEEDIVDNSDVKGTCISGTIEENFTKLTNESPAIAICVSESIKNLKETKSTLDTISADSIGITTSKKHIENIKEPLPDVPVCQDEEGSKEFEASRTIDHSSNEKTEVQTEPVAADGKVSELLNEERELVYSMESVLNQNSVKNFKVEESMLSSVDGKVEDNNIKISAEDPSDVHSQSLQVDKDNSILKQQSYGSAVGHPDCSIDTISQTDSVDGNWGSVSDGCDVLGSNTPAPKEAAQITSLEKTDVQSSTTDIFEPPSFMTLVEPGKEGDLNSAASEIQGVTNPEQVQPSPQTVWFPSLTTQALNDSQRRKKNEKIIEKVATWDSGKSNSSLKSFLVGPIVESQQKVKTTQSNLEPRTEEKDVSQKQNDDEGLKPKIVNPTKTAKTNENKEWDSPARLPVTVRREKKKMKQWVPFMCCSSPAQS